MYNKVKESEFECSNKSHFLVQLEHGNGGTGNVLDFQFTRFEEGVRVRSSVVKH